VIGCLLFCLVLLLLGLALWLAASVFLLVLAAWICWVVLKVIVKLIFSVTSGRD
jgi:hypothetical protein